MQKQKHLSVSNIAQLRGKPNVVFFLTVLTKAIFLFLQLCSKQNKKMPIVNIDKLQYNPQAFISFRLDMVAANQTQLVPLPHRDSCCDLKMRARISSPRWARSSSTNLHPAMVVTGTDFLTCRVLVKCSLRAIYGGGKQCRASPCEKPQDLPISYPPFIGLTVFLPLLPEAKEAFIDLI